MTPRGQMVQTSKGDVRIRTGSAAELIELRHSVLRSGLPRETAIFPADDQPQTIHIIAVRHDGSVIGCATLLPSTWDNSPAWQLRGMAIDPAFRGVGIGRAMMAYIEQLLLSEISIHTMWCNARLPAVGFYEGLGWRVTCEQFEIPLSGPHVKMMKRL